MSIVPRPLGEETQPWIRSVVLVEFPCVDILFNSETSNPVTALAVFRFQFFAHDEEVLHE